MARRRSLLALLTLLGVAFLPGCCGAKCASGVTFTLQSPLAADQFEIMVTNGDPNRARTTTCEATTTGVGCTYAPPLFATFDAGGRLESIQWLDAPNGRLHLVIQVNGVPVIDQMFDHPYAPGSMVCGTTCAASQTFTVQ